MTDSTGVAIKQALVEDLRECKWSRADVAEMLSRAAGRSITEHQIDAWAAETKAGYRFPAEMVGAWVKVIGSRRVLDVICGEAGLYAVDDRERDLAAYGREKLKELRAQREAGRLENELWGRV